MDQAVVLRMQKTHRKNHQIRLDLKFTACPCRGRSLAEKFLHSAVFAGESFAGYRPLPQGPLLVAGRSPAKQRVFWPGIIRCPAFRGLSQKLDLDYACRPLAERCAHTIRAGIAAANHYRLLA